ncbi:Protein kinase domain [Sesbania bispinosa]|nr:Protein kinase domain [Sesbania bispinosa]
MEIQPVSEQPLRAVRGILARHRQMLEPLYEDFHRIGAGKFGDVFRCRDRLTQQDVAVKIITIPENEKRNGLPCRIIREVSILKELDHINVVRYTFL